MTRRERGKLRVAIRELAAEANDKITEMLAFQDEPYPIPTNAPWRLVARRVSEETQ